MSDFSLEVTFQGPAVSAGAIDARLLADTLAGYSEVFKRANELANGERSEASVLVQTGFKSGSFVADLLFVQHLAVGLAPLITAYSFLDANQLAELLGFLVKEVSEDSLLGLYKWLKGGNPEKVEQISDCKVELTIGQNKKQITNNVYNFYGDSAIRQGMERLTEPLRKTDVERIAMKAGGLEQSSIERSDASYFESKEPPLELTAEIPTFGERDADLIVTRLSFTERNKWTFIEKGATLSARIDDEDFWSKVHQREVAFSEGQRLRVRLAWNVIERNGKLISDNVIKKVYDVLAPPSQLHLDPAEELD